MFGKAPLAWPIRIAHDQMREKPAISFLIVVGLSRLRLRPLALARRSIWACRSEVARLWIAKSSPSDVLR